MNKLHTDEQLDVMRKRLYDRGTEVEKLVRHELTDTKVPVAPDWGGASAAPRVQTVEPIMADAPPTPETLIIEHEPPKRRYRGFVLGGSFLIFIFAAAISAVYWYLGGNQFSNNNISVSLQGQPMVGGGEVLELQVAVANQNDTQIDSGVLILRYPEGTRSVDENPRNLYEERISLNTIAPGEVQNVPVRVAVFGEVNAEKEIAATVEYRVNGSNGTFYKDAEPLHVRISSAPLVLKVDGVEKVASGQQIEVKITATANASNPLENVLVTASYPAGFSFERSDPEPVYGQNVWKIDKLNPEETTTIVVTGTITGLTAESLRMSVEAGPAKSDNQFMVGSKLAEAKTDFTIERPFIDATVAINGDRDGEAVIAEGESGRVQVEIKNTLDESVYDMAIEVVPGGNALTESSIKTTSGFYDSNRGVVRWAVANNPDFKQVNPGDTRTLLFDVKSGPVKPTASFDMVVNIYARRVAESSAQETLIGSVKAGAKYSSTPVFGSQAGRNVGRFGDSGPVPPKVGELTTYTLTIAAEAGVNNLSKAVMKTSLPIYVEWLNQYDAPGEVTYNPVSKELEWTIDDISARERKELIFQVGIEPSVSQINKKPALLDRQTFEAIDQFSGARLQDVAGAVTTELSSEMGFGSNSGAVIE